MKKSPGVRHLLTLSGINTVHLTRLLWLPLALWFVPSVCSAQDLTPRAYLITPVHSNAITLTYSYFNGPFFFVPTLPIKDATGNPQVGILSYYHSLNFFGRSANFTASLPYGFGHFQGEVFGTDRQVYRSGLLDAAFRFSVNLKGGPAMNGKEFMSWHQKWVIGTSFTMYVPTGQYDPAKLINQGTNRWSFKPEIGISRRWGHWVLDTYAGVWFFTTNNDYFSHNPLFNSDGTNTFSQKPIGAFEGHLSYDVKPRLWFSVDGNFWFGGRTVINGVQNPLTLQSNSRIGVTASFPVTKRQSFKVSFNDGAYIRLGGDYRNVSIAWQYSWLGKRW
ncbi:MAG: transporter [Terriglobia bacterium]